MQVFQPRLRQRIAALMWLRRALWLGIPLALYAMFWRSGCAGCAALELMLGLLLQMALLAWEQSLRRQFIRDAALPRFLVAKLKAAHPQLGTGDADLVVRGLRQFFMAHLRSGRRFVGMPSRVADSAWHEFILHTQAYQAWCASAFGGMLHHTPAEVLGRDPKRNDGLRRSWYWVCKEESINPRTPARLPLLFALDRKFEIEGGFHYVPDCRAIDRASGSYAYCATSFGASGDGAGDAGSFGGSESSSSDGDGGSDSSGCGGGCGGGD